MRWNERKVGNYESLLLNKSMIQRSQVLFVCLHIYGKDFRCDFDVLHSLFSQKIWM
ncbi:hypothetical protein LguiA_011717 [Lonicera macranthoides]